MKTNGTGSQFPMCEAEDLFDEGKLTKEKFFEIARAVLEMDDVTDLEPVYVLAEDEWLRELGWI